MKVRFRKLSDKAVTPSYAKYGDAGMDLTAISRRITDQFIEYSTGLSIEIPEGYVGLIFPRSSVSKKDQVQANSVGVIDSGYRGEILVRFKDLTRKGFSSDHFNEEDKIAQLIIIPYPNVELEEVSELSDSERGTGGFGHTGN